MNLFRRRRDLIGPLLLLLNVGLVLVLLAGLQGTSDVPSRGADPEPPATREEPPLVQFKLPPLDHYAESIERPLFNMSRRPEDDDPKSAAADSELILSGVVVTPTRREVLLLTRRGEGVLRGEEGDWLAGWKVETIEPERVVLRRGARQVELHLERPARGGAPKAPAASSPNQPMAPAAPPAPPQVPQAEPGSGAARG
ncbi:MAG: hypothetical protein ACOZAI_01530 [Pseudomonadota bacterium]